MIGESVLVTCVIALPGCTAKKATSLLLLLLLLLLLTLIWFIVAANMICASFDCEYALVAEYELCSRPPLNP